MSTASELSALAVEAYAKTLTLDPHRISVLDWMWHPEGLHLLDMGGAAIVLYARIYSATSTGAGIYFESASKAAACLGFDRKTVIRARKALESRGVISRVGVQIVTDEDGVARMSRSSDPTATVNRQCGWIVDPALANKAAEVTTEAMKTLSLEDLAPVPASESGNDATATNSINSFQQTQDIVETSKSSDSLKTTGSVLKTSGAQDVVVASNLPKASQKRVGKPCHHLTTCGNTKNEQNAVNKVLRSSSYIHKKTGGAGDTTQRERDAFARLVETWPNRKASQADFGAYRELLGAGYSVEAIQLGAESFAAWSSRTGKVPCAPLAWFLRLDKAGKPNSFLASAVRELCGGSKSAHTASRRRQTGPYTADDLELHFIASEGAWDVATPCGYSTRIYPCFPLNRPDADRKALADALTAARGQGWRTFVGASESDVEFAWSDSAAWGGCWVAKARNGFTASMHGPCGSDRRATKKQLLVEFNNTSKLYRRWLDHGGADSTSDMRKAG